MALASCMPLTKPRQAFVMSKFWQDDGSPIAWWTPTAVDGSRCARLTEVLTMSPIRAGSTPASATAFDPAMAAPSAYPTPSDHHRRSRMPASRSSRPGRSPTRRYTSDSRSSRASDVTTTGASSARTVSTVVLVGRKTALPLTWLPVRLSGGRAAGLRPAADRHGSEKGTRSRAGVATEGEVRARHSRWPCPRPGSLRRPRQRPPAARQPPASDPAGRVPALRSTHPPFTVPRCWSVASSGTRRAATEPGSYRLDVAVADMYADLRVTPLLRRLPAHTRGLLSTVAGSISVVDPEQRSYAKIAETGVRSQLGRSFPLDEGATGRALSLGRPVVIARPGAAWRGRRQGTKLEGELAVGESCLSPRLETPSRRQGALALLEAMTICDRKGNGTERGASLIGR